MGIIDLSTNGHELTNMLCHCQKRFLMLLATLKCFNSLDLQFEYHQLPFHKGDKVKITFWGIDQNGMDSLYNWKFLPFGLKNAF